MEVALLESLQNFEKDQEEKLMASSNNQFDEEQIVQMAIKESMKQLPPGSPAGAGGIDEYEA
jgi:hypothetical protein